jgi:anaerobic ribonucleoside-triphosphate reductase activating protein
MRIELSRLHFPVTTLGFGRRVGIWFQGCSIRCPGCVSVDTWASGRGETTVEEVLQTVAPWLSEADGVTISGGEPFDQPEALALLLRELRTQLAPSSDVLVYSGHPWEKIESTARDLADVVISDPFRTEAPRTLLWRGSDNQRMHLLTDLARERYASWQHARRDEQPRRLDLAMLDGEVWMAGIPEPGMLQTVRDELALSGFVSGTSEVGLASSVPIFA